MEEEGGFEDTVIEEEVHRIVAQEIEKLPEEQRKVVYFHMEGKNNFEIAEIMQISVNTVKHYLTDIFCKLDIKKREELKQYMLN